MYICKAYRGISVIVVVVKERKGSELGCSKKERGTRHKAS